MLCTTPEADIQIRLCANAPLNIPSLGYQNIDQMHVNQIPSLGSDSLGDRKTWQDRCKALCLMLEASI